MTCSAISTPGYAERHVPASGALDLEVLNASITLDTDKPNSVFHPGGTAIVIHAGKDDYGERDISAMIDGVG